MKFSLKKILLFTFVFLEFTSLYAFTNLELSDNKTGNFVTDALRPRITISFEIARRRDCLGFGICNWGVDITILRANSCVATIYEDEANRNVLILEIDKAKGISPASYEKYFSSGTFLLEDEVPVPGDVLKALAITGSKTMLAGKHKFTERNGLIYISIPVK